MFRDDDNNQQAATATNHDEEEEEEEEKDNNNNNYSYSYFEALLTLAKPKYFAGGPALTSAVLSPGSTLPVSDRRLQVTSCPTWLLAWRFLAILSLFCNISFRALPLSFEPCQVVKKVPGSA